ncbi:His-Xaa-Ser system protein HxsD [Vibrio parahaemolyticus]|uniref:His-Xaa-Ser system protein HxsD n=2 Tax=Vibrio parahaemolyticus TaxID=670 RepID=A0A0F2IHD2_VIBPH|nr:His-Xaa-Ser system protein HxsD [Vibrio parahaemolyticus]ARC20215.1 His-Xaa-Ser system protein HxsD [Vibrio parahaemolyticus]AZV72741.1 His-Xaa-Ser system protein HxsD [Vibrio parahaemolyticus]EGQ8008259.1 His-Xaa-Ser system protein HxsD [Vibrio parahaemolyticus]EGQ8051885.1 His-Xaa-Ser system protein HxsD [Vibrio parahaemolyticus]EGQ8303624.1 His-Xaa-Ser system protein HxsD [Vibrio parahaemolyticus]
MLIHQLEKSTFSESVVRHALYWMSPLTTWKLADEDIRWTVHFSSQDEDIILEFERLLNDYLLREKLSKKTSSYLEGISAAVLSSVEKKLSK